MTAICASTHSKGIILNMLNRRDTNRNKIDKKKTKEMLQRMESLKTKISILRQQCETIKATMDKPQLRILCSKCGQPTKRNEAATFKTDTTENTLCKKCFGELWS